MDQEETPKLALFSNFLILKSLGHPEQGGWFQELKFLNHFAQHSHNFLPAPKTSKSHSKPWLKLAAGCISSCSAKKIRERFLNLFICYRMYVCGILLYVESLYLSFQASTKCIKPPNVIVSMESPKGLGWSLFQRRRRRKKYIIPATSG
jgi:hypothetical protein